MKTKQKTNKSNTGVYVLLSVLALLLVAALLVGVGGKTKTVYVPAPPTASSDFSGTMLSDYDTLSVNLSSDYVNFNFGEVKLSSYDYIVLDIMDASLEPNDTHSISFGLVFRENDTETFFKNTASVDSTNYSESSGPHFDNFIEDDGISYILDLRDLENGNIRWITYLNGLFHNSGDFTSIGQDAFLTDFKITFNPMSEYADSYEIGGMYLYGFENAEDCTIGDYISDSTLKLTDCKDSMLYTGE